jgi:hypothetical protein
MSDKDASPLPSPEHVAKRGYQGTHDPGQPTNLMQPQLNPTSQAGAQPAGDAPSQGSANQGGSEGGTGRQDSGSN